jgi:hypothetical protein
MSTATISETSVVARALTVSTRLPDQIADLRESIEVDVTDGALLETMLGRYVLDRDGRELWLLIDGTRRVVDIAETLAAARGLPARELTEQVRALCARLAELKLVEPAIHTAP